MAPAISLNDVVFRFWKEGTRNILDHTTFDIPGGGITVLMGASGCGKSTLAAVAAGLYPENGGYLEQGEISLFGTPLSGLDPSRRARLMTVMFQNPDLQFCMNTLRSEMRFCLENISVPPEEMDARMNAAAAKFGMTALLDRTMTTLSGGEKQKAALCCLYVMESRCILLDEPFANIDPDAAGEILKILSALKEQGTTVIAIDHRLEGWLDIADEVILLGEGAHVAARGISRENIAGYRSLFAEQGVFFPEEPEPRAERHTENPPALTLRDVNIPMSAPKRRFGRKEEPVLLMRGINAAFPAGQMTAILGPSGCGKTTTFLSILKQHPCTGTILLGDRDIAGMKKKELYRQVGIVFQNPANQFITQNVEEEVRAGIRIWEPGLDEEECGRRAQDMLERYGLLRQKRYSPYMLSQGQQRRLAVLSVLAGKQRILFLDEPTYGQDQRSTDAIMEQLRDKTREEGLTVVFITHDRSLAARWADKIYRCEDRTLREVRA